jgi:hypothetical protein
MKEAIPRRRGRPPSHPNEVKRCEFQFRVRRSIYEAIRAAAVANGRSFSEEIEFRLEVSLRDGSLVQDSRSWAA